MVVAVKVLLGVFSAYFVYVNFVGGGFVPLFFVYSSYKPRCVMRPPV